MQLNDQEEFGKLSPDQTAKACAAFEFVLDAAVVGYEVGQLQLFHNEDEEFIRREVERKLYKPELPYGGAKERAIIDRLKKMSQDEDLPPSVQDRARYGIGFWSNVLAKNPNHYGAYYIRKPITAYQNKSEFEWLTALRDSAHINRLWDQKWLAKLLLEGVPEPISDFVVEVLFILRKSNGTVDRLVRLHNVSGESCHGPHYGGSVILDDEAFAAPEKFRRWGLRHGNFSWDGNQKDLAKLHRDVGRMNAFRIVNQVESVGSLKVGNSILWFCDDCCYVDGELLRPDSDGIYWFKGEGYYLSIKGRESAFAQGRPQMHPDKSIKEVIGDLYPDRSEAEMVRDFFAELCDKFYDTIGGYGGWLPIGTFFSYAAAPEIFAAHRLFPGLMVHGQMSSGKTKLVEWLMHFWGYGALGPISLQEGSVVGLQQEAENYSDQPLWLDEFEWQKITEGKIALIKDSFNRLAARKWSPDGVQREIRTSFIVSGESTSANAAMRSRFPHIQVAATSRLRNWLEWMDANKHRFFIFARTLLERRKEFVELVQAYVKEWISAPQLKSINQRDRMAYGIPWASWQAMAELLDKNCSKPGGVSSTKRGEFLRFMIEHTKLSAAEVRSETNINVFKTDLITAFKAGAIPLTCFRLESEHIAHAPGRPGQQGWNKQCLFIDPNQTISAMKIHLAKERGSIVLGRKDLQAQLSKMPGWIPGTLSKRFGPVGDMTTITCWGFNLDETEMGYQMCADEDVNDFLMNPTRGDPRKGPLYSIVAALEEKEREIARASA